MYHIHYLRNITYSKNDCKKKKKNCENNFHIPTYVCFLFVGKTCRKTWTFTRVPQLEFVGDANEEITNVNDIGKQNALKI